MNPMNQFPPPLLDAVRAVLVADAPAARDAALVDLARAYAAATGRSPHEPEPPAPPLTDEDRRELAAWARTDRLAA